MNNRPYLSETSNIYNENLYNIVPTRFGNNNLIITHGQQRKMYDTTNTSITGPQQYPQSSYSNNIMYQPFAQQHFQQPIQLPVQRQIRPDGVTYTFNPTAQNYALRQFPNPESEVNTNIQRMNFLHQQPLTLQQQIAMNELQKHALESMLLHEQFRQNPFKLQFHKDGQTNTDGLFNCSDHCPQKSILKSLDETGSKSKLFSDPSKPEQLFNTCAKRKQLNIKPKSPIIFEDKAVQFSPEQTSTDTQDNLVEHCACKQKQTSKAHIQTEPKKVTFDESNSTVGHSKRKRRLINRRRSRSVDEDSSDSHTSTSSNSSGEIKP